MSRAPPARPGEARGSTSRGSGSPCFSRKTRRQTPPAQRAASAPSVAPMGKLRVQPRRGGEASPKRAKRLRRADGTWVRPHVLTPAMPCYSPGLSVPSRPYGQGVGRSARGLPILWDSPGVSELRGSLWRMSPGAVREGSRKRGSSESAAEGDGLARKRQESTRRGGSQLPSSG